MKLDVVILAAGQGSRMKSRKPKVLHRLAGRPMLSWAIDAAWQLGPNRVHIVVGHGADEVQQSVDRDDVNWVLQAEQNGTGHAVAQALPALADADVVLVTYGDVPLVSVDTLRSMTAEISADKMSLLTVDLKEPAGYGRILRNEQGHVDAIVEQKDATPEQLRITEVNTGIMAVSAAQLRQWLPQLSNSNAQGEYYLTDIIAMAVADGVKVCTMQPASLWEVEGVNSRQQLQNLERCYQMHLAESLMAEGVEIADANRLDIRGHLRHGMDVSIDINCVFEGDVYLGDAVSIGPNCVISNSRIAAGTTIKANSVIEDTEVGSDCVVGPFARLRPGTCLADEARIGNFVETKNAKVGHGSKINHLSYVGDAILGESVNIGAGTITCNYDGVNKSKTDIGSGAFIGSNTSLVAPVTVGVKATVAAGSVVTKNVDDEDLAVARGRQRNIKGWQRPEKKS